MHEKKDFSKTTIAVLLVIAIVVSVLNTIILLNNFSLRKTSTKTEPEGLSQNGEVRLHIVNNNIKNNEPAQQASLRLNIVNIKNKNN